MSTTRTTPARWVAGLLLVVAVAVLAVPPPPALACSCADGLPVAPRLAEADAAMVGRIVDRHDPAADETGVVSTSRDVQLLVQVDTVVKGDLGPVLVVTTAAEGESCGVAATGRTGLLLYDRVEDETWGSGLCSEVAPGRLVEAAGGMEMAVATVEDPAWPPGTGPPGTADVALASPNEPAGSADPWTSAGVLAAALVVGLGVVVSRRVRRATPPS